MAMKGFKRNVPRFKVLTEDQEEAVHRASLQVLWETGIAFHDKRALDLLAAAGCRVDFNNERVRFPEWIIMESLAKCPKSFRVRARDPNNDLILSKTNVTYFQNSPGMMTMDLDTLEPRDATRKEFYDYITVLDFLPNMHTHIAFPLFGFAGVPQSMRLIESNAAKLRMSTKAQQEGCVLDNDRWIIQMAKATNQDIMQLLNPAEPLTYYENNVTAIFKYCDDDQPFHFASGPVGGATAPATIVGAQVQMNAVTLAGIVLTQLYKPGARVWVGNFTNMQNMRTGSPAFGDIANSLNESVFNQMWHRYQLPTWSSSCAWCSSKAIDFQAAYETSMAAFACALSGATVCMFQGGLTGERIGHPVKAILDDDVAGMIGRFLQGVEVSDETLAVDVIDKVGPIPGHFLNQPHTRKWWRKEQYMPAVADRLVQEEWITAGRKKAIDHGREKMQEILATHRAPLLPPEQEQAIEDILKEAREYYRKKGSITDEEWKVYQEDIHSPNYPYA
jgi:trimethylamine---corrinoid protein Co-methyltransferase